jgi:hypothetical protein
MRVMGLACCWCMAAAPVPAQAPARPAAAGPAAEATTATAAVQAAPAPLPDIIPPLSIHESSVMLRDTIARLESAPSPIDTPLKVWLDRKLAVVALYIQRLDRQYPTLPYYQWTQIASKKIRHATWRERDTRLDRVMPGVTALAFRASHADLEISQIAVIGKDGTKWMFNQPILMPADRPRNEICFLAMPTDLDQVIVSCRAAQDGGEWPRLTIRAGVCSIAESAKQAQHHIQLARDTIAHGDALGAARQARHAYEQLQEFKRSRQL